MYIYVNSCIYTFMCDPPCERQTTYRSWSSLRHAQAGIVGMMENA